MVIKQYKDFVEYFEEQIRIKKYIDSLMLKSSSRWYKDFFAIETEVMELVLRIANEEKNDNELLCKVVFRGQTTDAFSNALLDCATIIMMLPREEKIKEI